MKDFGEFTHLQLITFYENQEEYDEGFIQLVTEELDKRLLTDQQLGDLAEFVLRHKIRGKLKAKTFLVTDAPNFESHFLNKDQIYTIVQEEIAKYIDHLKDLNSNLPPFGGTVS